MVADNKKQQVSDAIAEPEPHASNEGGVRSSGSLLPTEKSKKKFILYSLVIVIVLVGAVVLIKDRLHLGEKVYAQAAGHKIYKEDVKDLIGNTKGITDRQAATVLADKYLTEAMAKDADITVSSKELTNRYGSIIDKLKTRNPYVYQQDVNTVYFDKLSAYNSGFYIGKLIVTNFSRHIAFESPFLEIQQASDPLLGNPEAVAQDKKYAKNLIDQLYNQIKSGKITFDQAIQKEHDDPQLGIDAYKALIHSGPFDTSNVNIPGTSLVLPIAIKQKMQNMKAGELSKPFAVKVANSLTNKNATADSYYLVVRMDSTSGGHSGLSYSQYLDKAKKDLGYKVYV